MSRDIIIYFLEEYYITQMEKLVENEQFDESNALFEEFVVDGKEPTEWVFLKNIINK